MFGRRAGSRQKNQTWVLVKAQEATQKSMTKNGKKTIKSEDPPG